MENIKALANEFKALGGMSALWTSEDAKLFNTYETLVDAIESLPESQIVEAQQMIGTIVENFNY